MLVKECMTKNVEVTTPDVSLRDVARMMKEGNFGVIPVKKDERLIGMITDRDIIVRALSQKADLSGMKVADVMTSQVLYCFDDQPVDEVLDNLGNNQLWRMPVVNREKRLVGILSLCDLAQGDLDSYTLELAISRLGKTTPKNEKLNAYKAKNKEPAHTHY